MQPKSLMSLARLEAFSDGVFAFAATLLVIEFKIPDLHHGTPHDATLALFALGRPFLAYATSFFVIGVVWLNHHIIFEGLDSVDRGAVIINLCLLIVVAFLPFPTELIADYGRFAPIVAFYGIAQAATGLAFSLLWLYVERRYRIGTGTIESSRAIAISRLWAAGYPASALAGAFLAFWSTSTSIAIYAALPIVYLLPNAIEWQLTKAKS